MFICCQALQHSTELSKATMKTHNSTIDPLSNNIQFGQNKHAQYIKCHLQTVFSCYFETHSYKNNHWTNDPQANARPLGGTDLQRLFRLVKRSNALIVGPTFIGKGAFFWNSFFFFFFKGFLCFVFRLDVFFCFFSCEVLDVFLVC